MISWEKSLSPSFVHHIMSFSCFLTNYAAKFSKNYKTDFRSLKQVIEADYICNFNFKWQLISYSFKHFWPLRIQLQFTCYFLSLTSRRGIYDFKETLSTLKSCSGNVSVSRRLCNLQIQSSRSGWQKTLSVPFKGKLLYLTNRTVGTQTFWQLRPEVAIILFV